MLLALDLFSTICFAYAGASFALGIQQKYLGVCVSGFLMSTGGGTIRDILLHNDTLFWIDNPIYLLAVVVAIALAVLSENTPHVSPTVGRLIESLATSVFIMVGMLTALEAGSNWLVVALLGVLTGVGGGIVRQVFFGKRSIVENQMNICLAVIIALVCSVLMLTGLENLITIICLTLIHFLLRECYHGSVQKFMRSKIMLVKSPAPACPTSNSKC